MANKKYQVFVSSTFTDLKAERQAVISTILDLRHIPAGMELFPASDIDQFEYIKRIIDECDYYVLIIANRYGTIGKAGISYTEQEYDYACKTGKFVLAFLHSDPSSLPVAKSDTGGEAQNALESFRTKVKSGRLVREWKDLQELQSVVLRGLSAAFNDFPQVGWVRGDAIASDDLIRKNSALLEFNATLVAENTHFKEIQSNSALNLADINSGTTVHYTLSEWNSFQKRYDRTQRSIDTTWHDFFLMFAPLLKLPKTDVVFEMAIKEHRRGSGTYDLSERQKAILKAQYTALGLITTEVSRTTKGDTAEFIELTSEGVAYLQRSLIVTKSEDRTHDQSNH
ncbi:DUF4062 domain-containing protein [Brucella anthropi]|uniref:DUF4062 domain-containing protein n=1 Tax=Brucella anthropi TaxID=529 RepID=UPI0007751073|nr:DUF4062 domain-containing protein [Brucella anthropi]KXO76679.1 hypothetical protein AYJ56_08610 [Brucella anthropi]